MIGRAAFMASDGSQELERTIDEKIIRMRLNPGRVGFNLPAKRYENVPTREAVFQKYRQEGWSVEEAVLDYGFERPHIHFSLKTH